jgi:hypothetical protein
MTLKRGLSHLRMNIHWGCLIVWWWGRYLGLRGTRWQEIGEDYLFGRSNQEEWRLIHTCRAHAIPLPCCAAKGLDCAFCIWFTQCGRVWFTHAMPRPCHATTMPFWKLLLKTTAQRGMGMAWHVWINIGRSEPECERPARFRLLLGTMRSSTKVVFRGIPIC